MTVNQFVPVIPFPTPLLVPHDLFFNLKYSALRLRGFSTGYGLLYMVLQTADFALTLR